MCDTDTDLCDIAGFWLDRAIQSGPLIGWWHWPPTHGHHVTARWDRPGPADSVCPGCSHAGQQPVCTKWVWGEWIKLFSRRHRNGIIFTVNWHYCIASFPSGMNSARRGGELWVRAVGLRAGWDQTGPGSALLSSARSLLATECGLVVATACKHHTPGLWLAQSVPDLGADTWPNVLLDCPRRGRYEAARLSPGRVGDDNLRVTPTSIHWNCLMIMMEWQQWSWAASQWALGMWVIRRTVPSCQAASH